MSHARQSAAKAMTPRPKTSASRRLPVWFRRAGSIREACARFVQLHHPRGGCREFRQHGRRTARTRGEVAAAVGTDTAESVLRAARRRMCIRRCRCAPSRFGGRSRSQHSAIGSEVQHTARIAFRARRMDIALTTFCRARHPATHPCPTRICRVPRPSRLPSPVYSRSPTARSWPAGRGATGEAVAEVCFNTAMTGYQEILTDPSYMDQIVVFTFPHVGNVGVNAEDVEQVAERSRDAARGAVFHDAPTAAANWRAGGGPLRLACRARGGDRDSPGIDTRALNSRHPRAGHAAERHRP